MVVKRFQVFLVNLDPTVGSKIKKTQPCLVISPDEMNQHISMEETPELLATMKELVAAGFTPLDALCPASCVCGCAGCSCASPSSTRRSSWNSSRTSKPAVV